MGANHTREIMNSAAVVAAVKKMSPSAIFIFGMVLTVGWFIQAKLKDVIGYDIMIWIWFSVSMITIVASVRLLFKETAIKVLEERVENV